VARLSQQLEKGSQSTTLCAIMQTANAMKMADKSSFFIFMFFFVRFLLML